MKQFFLFSIIVAALAIAITAYQATIPNNSATNKLAVNVSQTPNETSSVEVVADNLDIPWAIAFLPNKDFLFTERTGKLKLYSKGKISTIQEIKDVKVYGEGGLLGVAVDPNYSSNHYIYLYSTYSTTGVNVLNKVTKYKFENSKLSDAKIILEKIPGSLHHNGGRLKFGPDNYLYVTTGDSENPSFSQNKDSLAGKILRLTTDGKAAPGNPFNTEIYSYGHRNPQGLSWDSSGRLWETEHGDNATDEVNIIVKGANYGWPIITGNKTKEGMQSPLAQSGNETWAPSGNSFLNGSLYFGGLKGQSLFQVKVVNGNAIITKHLEGEFGRIRDVVTGPDNFLYITTSNKDGRGTPVASDDRIIKVDPSKL